MAWIEGSQEKLNLPDVNAEFAAIRGNLTEEEAQKWIVKYFKSNIGVAAKLILGVDLLPFQELMIKGMFQRDYSMLIISRGGSKSFSVAVFCALFAILEQGTKIALLSKTFRQSRMIMQTIEEMLSKPEAALFKECMSSNPSHKNDEWSMKVGKSTIIALPLGTGDKLRGYRFRCMVIDEFLLMPEKIVNEVLIPFLSTSADPAKKLRTKRTEDALIKQGRMKEEDRVKFKNPKMICMSSASYKFEFLYKKYQEYVNSILEGYKKDENGNRKPLDGSYFVFQVAYGALPKELYNNSVIENSKKAMSLAQFNREFGSQFTDDSSGYFSLKSLNSCTFPEGSDQTVEVFGDPEAEYILSVDPSASEQETSDFFAMTLSKIKEGGKYQIVNSYAVAGGKFNDHTAYLFYLVKNFNIKFILLDNAGGSTFIRAANDSKLFKDAKIEIDLISNIDIKLAKTEKTLFDENVLKFREKYNEGKNIKAYCLYFDSDWIRYANELLQKDIDSKLIQFSCPLESNSSRYDTSLAFMENCKELDNLNFISNCDEETFGDKTLKEDSLAEGYEEDAPIQFNKGSPERRKGKAVDFVERQDQLMLLTKKQIGMIEPRQSSTGVITFDLPPDMKRIKGAARPRRDLYTTVFLGTWAVCVYNAMKATPMEDENPWGEYTGPVGFDGT